MNRYNRFFPLFCAFLLAALVTNCDGSLLTDLETFDYNLRGTWVTNQDKNQYSGQLIISYDKITIIGYNSNSQYELTHGIGDRPFTNITKNEPLSGYSEEGSSLHGVVSGVLSIKDWGTLKEFTYKYKEENGTKLLRFDFGNRAEILKCIGD